VTTSGPGTVLIFVGLPYTGKTTIIRGLLERTGGREIIADQIYLSEVSPSDVGLSHWLAYAPKLAKRIVEKASASDASVLCVELGIMPRKERSSLIDWFRDRGDRVVPFWLKCDDPEVLAERSALRAREKDARAHKDGDAKINISPGGIYQEIRKAFEEPEDVDGYETVSTDARDAESIVTLVAGMAGL
jgi:hypothetical protein